MKKYLKRIGVLVIACLLATGLWTTQHINIEAADSYSVQSVGTDTQKSVDENFLTVDGDVGYCAEKYVEAYPLNPNPINYDKIYSNSSDYENNTSKTYWLDDQNHWDDIRRAYYFGYSFNGASLEGQWNDDEFRQATQLVIWHYTDSFTDINQDRFTDGVKAAYNAILNAVGDSTKTVPSNIKLHFLKSSQTTSMSMPYQGVFYLKEEIIPTITNTTMQANGTKASGGTPAKVTINGSEPIKIEDIVSLNNLTAGNTYYLVLTVFNAETREQVGLQYTEVINATSTSYDGTITIGNLENPKAGKYTIKAEIKVSEDAEPVATHNGNLDIADETVEVTEPEPTPTPTPTTEPTPTPTPTSEPTPTPTPTGEPTPTPTGEPTPGPTATPTPAPTATPTPAPTTTPKPVTPTNNVPTPSVPVPNTGVGK